MVGNLESLGDAVTGGLVGRAVEPKAGEVGPEGLTHEMKCLNCGAELAGPFCHECGQHTHVHRTLTAFFHDFLHGVLHFEGKIWRTLPMLVWRPGELTRRYIDGQRARFVSPIALFLFCVFLLFAAVGLTSTNTHVEVKTQADVARDLRQDQQQLAVLERLRAGAAGPVARNLDEQISDLKEEMTALQAVKAAKVNFGIFKWLGGVDKRLANAAKDPELLFYKLKTNAYKFSWALIPISVPFVWLLFPFSRRFRLYDHTVFVAYSLCFMMLLLATATVVGLASDSLASIAAFVPPIHMYRQLRGAYGVSKLGALWRTFLLVIFAFIAISLFVSLLATIGAFE